MYGKSDTSLLKDRFTVCLLLLKENVNSFFIQSTLSMLCIDDAQQHHPGIETNSNIARMHTRKYIRLCMYMCVRECVCVYSFVYVTND